VPVRPEHPIQVVKTTTQREKAGNCGGKQGKVYAKGRRIVTSIQQVRATGTARDLHRSFAANNLLGRLPRPVRHTPYPTSLTHPRGPAAPPAAGLFSLPVDLDLGAVRLITTEPAACLGSTPDHVGGRTLTWFWLPFVLLQVS